MIGSTARVTFTEPHQSSQLLAGRPCLKAQEVIDRPTKLRIACLGLDISDKPLILRKRGLATVGPIASSDVDGF